MDTGLADILGAPVQYASPSLAVFDLYTDKLIRRHYFPDSLLKEDSFFANVVCIGNGIISKYFEIIVPLCIEYRLLILNVEIAIMLLHTYQILADIK